jgi:hypothetical protein
MVLRIRYSSKTLEGATNLTSYSDRYPNARFQRRRKAKVSQSYKTDYQYVGRVSTLDKPNTEHDGGDTSGCHERYGSSLDRYPDASFERRCNAKVSKSYKTNHQYVGRVSNLDKPNTENDSGDTRGCHEPYGSYSDRYPGASFERRRRAKVSQSYNTDHQYVGRVSNLDRSSP